MMRIAMVAQDGMRSVLPLDDKTSFLEGVDETSPRDLWEQTQAATPTFLVRIVRSGGMGRPSSWRPKTYPSMASRMFASASSFVSPWLAQPGRLGTYTEKPPAGSRSRMTVNCRIRMVNISVLNWVDGVKNDPSQLLIRGITWE